MSKNKTLFTLKIPLTDDQVRKTQPPVEKVVKSKKAYSRKIKHKSSMDWVAERPPYFFFMLTL